MKDVPIMHGHRRTSPKPITHQAMYLVYCETTLFS